MDNSAAGDDPRAADPAPAGPPAWPSISDYWPDAPHRVGPAADHYDDTAATDPGVVRDPFRLVRGVPPAAVPRGTGPDPEPPRRRGRLRAAAGWAVAAVLLTGAGTVLAGLVRDEDRRPAGAPAAPGPAGTTPLAPSATVPVPVPVRPAEPSAATSPRPAPTTIPGPATTTFELLSSLATVTVRSRDLGSDLVRVETPDGVVPRFNRTAGAVRLTLTRNGRPVAAAATVTLDDDVRWTVRLGGGAREGVLDLTGSAAERVELAGGGTRIDLRLPDTRAALPVRICDGIHQLRLHTRSEVPVRVRARQGAGRIDLYGSRRDGVARGGIVTGGDADGRGGVDVDADAGLGTLTVAEA